MLYECSTMDVQKGLRFCLRLSFTLCCHGLPVPKEKNEIKTLKQYRYITLKACGCFFFLLRFFNTWVQTRTS